MVHFLSLRDFYRYFQGRHYSYTPYLIWFRYFLTKFRRFLTKLEHHVRLTCLRLYRENQSARPPKCTMVLNPPLLKLYDSQKLALNNIYKFTKGQGYIVSILTSRCHQLCENSPRARARARRRWQHPN